MDIHNSQQQPVAAPVASADHDIIDPCVKSTSSYSESDDLGFVVVRRPPGMDDHGKNMSSDGHGGNRSSNEGGNISSSDDDDDDLTVTQLKPEFKDGYSSDKSSDSEDGHGFVVIRSVKPLSPPRHGPDAVVHEHVVEAHVVEHHHVAEAASVIEHLTLGHVCDLDADIASSDTQGMAALSVDNTDMDTEQGHDEFVKGGKDLNDSSQNLEQVHDPLSGPGHVSGEGEKGLDGSSLSNFDDGLSHGLHDTTGEDDCEEYEDYYCDSQTGEEEEEEEEDSQPGEDGISVSDTKNHETSFKNSRASDVGKTLSSLRKLSIGPDQHSQFLGFGNEEQYACSKFIGLESGTLNLDRLQALIRAKRAAIHLSKDILDNLIQHCGLPTVIDSPMSKDKIVGMVIRWRIERGDFNDVDHYDDLDFNCEYPLIPFYMDNVVREILNVGFFKWDLQHECLIRNIPYNSCDTKNMLVFKLLVFKSDIESSKSHNNRHVPVAGDDLQPHPQQQRPDSIEQTDSLDNEDKETDSLNNEDEEIESLDDAHQEMDWAGNDSCASNWNGHNTGINSASLETKWTGDRTSENNGVANYGFLYDYKRHFQPQPIPITIPNGWEDTPSPNLTPNGWEDESSPSPPLNGWEHASLETEWTGYNTSGNTGFGYDYSGTFYGYPRHCQPNPSPMGWEATPCDETEWTYYITNPTGWDVSDETGPTNPTGWEVSDATGPTMWEDSSTPRISSFPKELCQELPTLYRVNCMMQFLTKSQLECMVEYCGLEEDACSKTAEQMIDMIITWRHKRGDFDYDDDVDYGLANMDDEFSFIPFNLDGVTKQSLKMCFLKCDLQHECLVRGIPYESGDTKRALIIKLMKFKHDISQSSNTFQMLQI